MKKTLSVLATVAVLSLGLTACADNDDDDCESAGLPGVTAMSLTDGKSGGSSGGRSSRSGGGKSSSGKSGTSKTKPGTSKPKYKHHDFDDDCDD